DFRMDTMKDILKRTLESYTGEGLNGYSYLTSSADEQVFTSVCVGYLDGKQFVFADLIVRIIADKIVIDHDANSDPVYEELLEVGFPRSQIILAYAGEPAPEIA